MAESKKKCRQYSVEYLKFRFLSSKADKRLPTCLLCNKVLSNDSMKPSKLEDHLRRCHSDKIGKDLKYFQTLKEKYKKRLTVQSILQRLKAMMMACGHLTISHHLQQNLEYRTPLENS
ncbi:Protein FAM200B [Eumeta japonica]|uniref:Protein FAM200B n=1 Tax=Eumeta variegata TaxID=151549 RepID=A0A4C1XAT4_EUMVA|nr:Protein FAM200B [Eumeta japonica]